MSDIICCCICGKQIIRDLVGHGDKFVTCGPVIHMGCNTFACIYCSAELDENGLFLDERSKCYEDS